MSVFLKNYLSDFNGVFQMSQVNVLVGFMAPAPVSTSSVGYYHPTCCRLRPKSATLRLQPRRSASPFLMMSTPSDSESQSEPEKPKEESSDESDTEEPRTSASEILKTLREDSAADMASQPPEDERASRSMLGVYRDVDGRSNVWAVEPQEETDTRPQFSKTIIVLVAIAFTIGILLILPILPLTNPDQV